MKLMHILRKDSIIREQIILLVRCSYLIEPITKCYRELFEKAREETEAVQRLYRYETDHSVDAADDPSEAFQRSLDSNIIFNYYKVLSTIVITFTAAKNILPLQWFASFLQLGIAPHCFVPGRIVLYGTIPAVYVIIVCTSHLYWRFEKLYINPTYRLDLVTFMLHRKLDIDRTYALERKMYREDDLSPNDRYLLSIMYYPVNCGRRTFYRLRPNRTREARDEISREIARQTIVSGSIMISLVVFVGPIIAYSALNNIDYVQDYPTCSPFLDKRLEDNELTPFSVTFEGHKLLVNLFEAVENIVFWVDSAAAVSFATGLVYLLNYDLLLYWRCLNERLGHLLVYVRLKHRLTEEGGNVKGDFGYVEEEGKLEYMSQLQFYDANSEEPSFEIHCMASDFFKQIRCVDAYMSCFIRLVVLIWLAHSSSLSYCALVEKPEKMLPLKSMQFIALALLPFAIYTLILNHKTLRTYQVICSLVALIDTRYKKNYMQLLGYYSGRSWATYTLFDHPYRPTTLLTLIGWTFSCGVIVDNLVRSIKNLEPNELNKI